MPIFTSPTPSTVFDNIGRLLGESAPDATSTAPLLSTAEYQIYQWLGTSSSQYDTKADASSDPADYRARSMLATEWYTAGLLVGNTSSSGDITRESILNETVEYNASETRLAANFYFDQARNIIQPIADSESFGRVPADKFQKSRPLF